MFSTFEQLSDFLHVSHAVIKIEKLIFFFTILQAWILINILQIKLNIKLRGGSPLLICVPPCDLCICSKNHDHLSFSETSADW